MWFGGTFRSRDENVKPTHYTLFILLRNTLILINFFFLFSIYVSDFNIFAALHSNSNFFLKRFNNTVGIYVQNLYLLVMYDY